MTGKARLATASFAFGSMGQPRPDRAGLDRARFRIALLGDFSGRAARGALVVGDALAARRGIRFDIDTLDRVIAGFATRLTLPLGKDGAGVEVALGSLDDLHPDELVENVALFDELATLKRSLKAGATAEKARERLQEWGREHGRRLAPPRRNSRGNRVPANLRLSDFQRLIGAEAAPPPTPGPADALIARLVGPHVRAAPDPDLAALEQVVDAALGDAMRMILHHPEFQALEAQWRTLDLLARRIETDDGFDIVLYDISAEEIAADLAAVEDLGESGLCRLLAEGTPDGRGNFSALVGLYTFEEVPPHAELLGRIARLAAHLDAPFVAAMAAGTLGVPTAERHPLTAAAWDALRAMPEAGHLMLATPRFLLRHPYGRRSDPIDTFPFEEFTEAEGFSGLLWTNPAALVAILMAQSWRLNGPALKLGSVLSLGGIPYIHVTDRFGDQVALPCTERNMTQTRARAVIARGYAPVLTVKGRDEVRLAAFVSLAGRVLLGPWARAPTAESPPSPPASTHGDADAGEGWDSDLDGQAAAGDDEDGQEDSDAASAANDSPAAAEDLDGETEMDDELAALLAEFDDATPDAATDEDDSGDDDEMDPELAALLAEL